ncbi:MAG: alpha/beta hydrolase [Armatimonadetes bacterium]|nr:alpha/beta hydrolase [Armatimonadota bacterium]
MRTFLLCGLLALPLAATAQHFAVAEYHDVVYTQGGGIPQALDAFMPLPVIGNGRAAIVFVHGGGWAAGSKADFDDWGRYYAAKGYVCVSIDYRLAPQSIWPAQIDDTQAAVRWMRKWAPVLAIDPDRIGALGASAGGHLVLLLAGTDTLHDTDPDLRGYSSRVKQVVDFCGPTDFSNADEWNPAIWPLVTQMVGKPWSKLSMLYRAASPLSHVTPGDTECLLLHGTADDVVPVDQSRRLAAKMQATGVPVEYMEFPGEGHGFSQNAMNACLPRIDAHFAKL